MSIRHTLILTAAITLLAATPKTKAASFTGLGQIYGDTSLAQAVSADGSVLVGTGDIHIERASSHAIVWTKDGEGYDMSGICDPDPWTHSGARGVSADGSVVVGRVKTGLAYAGYGNAYTPNYDAFYYKDGEVSSLGHLPGGRDNSTANAVSGNGLVVVGESYTSVSHEAFRWENGVMMGLGGLSDESFRSIANDVSADGSVVVGESTLGDFHGSEAFYWKDGTMTGMGYLEGGDLSVANGVSNDGSIVAGWSRSKEYSIQAFIWRDGIMEGLGVLERVDSRHSSSYALDVSGDGKVVVGYSEGNAFVWDESNGMRDIKALLENEFAFDLTGWELKKALAISADGTTIIGSGNNPDGDLEGWVAIIPEPCSLVLLGLGSFYLRVNLRSGGRMAVP